MKPIRLKWSALPRIQNLLLTPHDCIFRHFQSGKSSISEMGPYLKRRSGTLSFTPSPYRTYATKEVLTKEIAPVSQRKRTGNLRGIPNSQFAASKKFPASFAEPFMALQSLLTLSCPRAIQRFYYSERIISIRVIVTFQL